MKLRHSQQGNASDHACIFGMAAIPSWSSEANRSLVQPQQVGILDVSEDSKLETSSMVPGISGIRLHPPTQTRKANAEGGLTFEAKGP